MALNYISIGLEMKRLINIAKHASKIIWAKKNKKTAVKQLKSATNGQSQYAALKAITASENLICEHNEALQAA